MAKKTMKLPLIITLFAVLTSCSKQYEREESPPPITLKWQSNVGFAHSIGLADNKQFFCIQDETVLKSCRLDNPSRILWKKNITNGLEKVACMRNGRIYITDLTGNIFCIDKETGKTLWQKSIDAKIVAAPVIYATQTKELILISAYDNQVHALDPYTGKTVWIYKADNFLNAEPAINNEYIVFGSCGGNLFILNDNGKLHKKIDLRSPLAAPAVITDNTIFIGSHSGGFFAISLASGEIISKYFAEDDSRQTFMSAPLIYHNKVYMTDDNGNIYCIDKDIKPDSTAELCYSTAAPITAPIQIIGDYMFIADQNGIIHMMNTLTYTDEWLNNGAQIESTASYDNILITADLQGVVTIFEVTK